MKEFHFWVAIVTLLLFLNLTTWVAVVYMDRKLAKTEALCVRFEEKKNRPKLEPKLDKEE